MSIHPRALALSIILVLVGASPAMSAERRVSKVNDLACGMPTDFHTIQGAVNAANPGDTVKVCPGQYDEQVSISGPGKNNLKLESVKQWQAAIRFPQGLMAMYTSPKAVVLVRQATGVVIHDFTIEGPWTDGGGCASPLAQHYGVRVDTGGSAKIDDNHITLIEDANAALRGCQDGVAIQVGRNGETTTGSAEIVHNVIDKYQKNGATIDGPASFGNIHDNTIDGGGDNNMIAKNGLQVGREASAKVEHNRVFNNYYSGNGPPPAQDPPDDGNDGTGILIFEVTGDVTVHDNTFYLNDEGVSLGVQTANIEMGFGPTTGVLIDANITNSNVFDGLRAHNDATGNTFHGNKSSSNGTEPGKNGHDCHDDSTGGGTAGTANTWKDNQGVTQTPAGICKPPS